LIFRRSDQGTSNYRFFLEVDLLVYVEGKSDISFWKKIFELYKPGIKLKIEQKDGGENLNDIVESIRSGAIDNTVVCRDSDYNILQGKKTDHHRILYTYGYSFENDYIGVESACAVAQLVSPQHLSDELIRRAFRIYIHSLAKVGEWLLKMDVCYDAVGRPLISRRHLKDLTKERKDKVLLFDNAEITARLSSRREGVRRKKINFAPYEPIFPRYYSGHTMFHVLVSWCRAIADRKGGKALNAANTVIKNHLISHYQNLVDCDIQEYMRLQVEAV